MPTVSKFPSVSLEILMIALLALVITVLSVPLLNDISAQPVPEESSSINPNK